MLAQIPGRRMELTRLSGHFHIAEKESITTKEESWRGLGKHHEQVQSWATRKRPNQTLRESGSGPG